MSAEFIKMISELHEERFNVHLADLVKNKTPCGIFFGFVMIPSEAAENTKRLIKVGINVSCAIVLADVQANALRDFVGVPVITLEDFPSFGEENFPVVKPQEVFFMKSLKDLAFAPYFARYGIESLILSDGEKFSRIMKHLPEIYSVYEMLGSAESKKVFCAKIKGNLTGKIGNYRFASEPQYFLDEFLPTKDDIAIDGGAFDGGTTLAFAKRGANVFAFEMDAANYKNCKANLEKFGGNFNITLENLGLSNKEGEEFYFSRGTGSYKNSKGKLTARFIDLDTYVARKNLPRVDYIKLDIEGAELEMLCGAAKIITRCKPKMAVSAYHRTEDLWTLATYIKSLRADYEFEFRHYRIDCTDYMLNNEERALLKYFGLNYFVPSPAESVLYCK